MGKMYTLKPDESINDHVKESMSIINHIVELSIGCMRDLANPHEGTFVDMTYNKFMRSIEHIRESIQMLDDDIRKCRAEYEQEREHSNQLEAQVKVLNAERDLAKKLAKQKSEELKRKLNEKYGTDVACMELEDKLDKKCREIGELTSVVVNLQNELDHVYEKIELIKADRDRYFKQLYESGYFDTDILHMYPKTTINNPANFCGNCRHYAQMGKDDGDFEGICTQHYIKRVDPDDASCKFFKPTYNTRVVIDKPEFPVCEKCNRDDCDNCTLCPF